MSSVIVHVNHIGFLNGVMSKYQKQMDWGESHQAPLRQQGQARVDAAAEAQ